VYVDNSNEGDLLTPMMDVARTPKAIDGALSMGRLWLCTKDAVWASEPGRYGTFLKTSVIYPDSASGDITGCHPVAGGVLVTTLTSSFLVQMPTSPTGGVATLRRVPVSNTVGCAAPNSLQTMYDGSVIWLSREGWVRFDNNAITPLRGSHERLMRQLNIGRLIHASAAVIDGVYHCWVPRGGEKVPATCVMFAADGRLVGRRTDLKVRSATTLRDHTRYTLVAGEVSNRSGVLVVNHTNATLGALSFNSTLETSWMFADGVTRRSHRRIIVWARETDGTRTMTVEVMRDWREDVIDTMTIPLYPAEDAPDTWDNTLLGSGTTWSRRRPYYGILDIDVPSAEALKLRFTASGDVEYLGFMVQSLADSTRSPRTRLWTSMTSTRRSSPRAPRRGSSTRPTSAPTTPSGPQTLTAWRTWRATSG
jgi:hypothetical protein